MRPCRYCANQFEERRPDNLYCSRECSKRYNYYHPRGARSAVNCEWCSEAFRPKQVDRIRFCSRACAFQWLSDNKPKPFCVVYFPRCVSCGRVFCSRREGKFTCSPYCHHKNAYKKKPARDCICKVCGRHFQRSTSGAAAACSLRCKKKRKKILGVDAKAEQSRLRKARRKDAFVERVIRRAIYERDGWKCGICGKRVNDNLAVPHPLAKTIDHIIPLSKGGTHEPKNVRLAHFICNSKRGNDIVAQLRMF